MHLTYINAICYTQLSPWFRFISLFSMILFKIISIVLHSQISYIRHIVMIGTMQFQKIPTNAGLFGESIVFNLDSVPFFWSILKTSIRFFFCNATNISLPDLLIVKCRGHVPEFSWTCVKMVIEFNWSISRNKEHNMKN